MSKLYIIEGPDCSGKTSLAAILCRIKRAAYFHASGHASLLPGMEAYHLSILESAERNLSNGIDVVLDRHWPSEVVYGTVLRPRATHPYNVNKMLNFLTRLDVTYVICGDEQMPMRHAAEQNLEHPYNPSQFMQICAEYGKVQDFLFGRADVKHYSILTHGATMSEFIEQL